jgi:hypothetical protein
MAMIHAAGKSANAEECRKLLLKFKGNAWDKSAGRFMNRSPQEDHLENFACGNVTQTYLSRLVFHA